MSSWRDYINEGNFPSELGKLSIFWKLSLIHKEDNFDTVLWQKRCNLYNEKKSLILEPKTCAQKMDHPLSLQTNSTWKSHFDVGELKKTISQDVTRTFPDIDFYRRDDIQRHMRDVLLVYSKFVSKFSYRQGMHELLAPIIYVMRKELDESPVILDFPLADFMFVSAETFDSHCFALFSLILDYTEMWYDNDTWNTVEFGQKKTPLMILSDLVHETYLKEIDPILYNHLFKILEIEPQVYIIRWTRLLFAREFGFETLLEVWSALFRTHLRLVPYICISMLVKLRDRLLVSDLHEALENLMKFPNSIGYEKVLEFSFHLLNTPLKDILRDFPPLPPVRKLELPETKESPVKAINGTALNAIRYGVSLVGNAFASNSEERVFSRREKTVALSDLDILEDCLLKITEAKDLESAKELANVCLKQVRKLKP